MGEFESLFFSTWDDFPWNGPRVSATEKCSLGPCLVDNQQCHVPYRIDSDRKIIKRKQSHCPLLSTFKTQRNPLDSFQNIHAIRFQQRRERGNSECGNSLRTPKIITRQERLPSQWAAVTLSQSASTSSQ